MYLASIVNPALPPALGTPDSPTAAAAVLAKYIGTLWTTAVILGGLALLIYLIIAALNWIMAGGDKTKIETAKTMITQGLIGMIVLVSIAAISVFLSTVLGMDLLKPVFSNNL